MHRCMWWGKGQIAGTIKLASTSIAICSNSGDGEQFCFIPYVVGDISRVLSSGWC